MKPTPCSYCGATYHQPYEDGLVECRETLKSENERLEDCLNELRAAVAAMLKHGAVDESCQYVCAVEALLPRTPGGAGEGT